MARSTAEVSPPQAPPEAPAESRAQAQAEALADQWPRVVAHVDCDAFFAAIEKRDRPELADRPVLVGSPTGRGVVTTACYVARAYGPRSAMPMFKALALCPEAIVIRPDMAKYKAASRQIRALMARLTPVVEVQSIDEAMLELSPGVRHDPGPVARQLRALQAAVTAEVGITVSVGLSANKFLARLASGWTKPNGFTVLDPARAASLLAPLPVTRIHGIGPATARRLAGVGLTTIADLQAAGEAALIAQLGSWGRALWQRSFGIDTRPVEPERVTKSVSVEDTFERDLSSFEALAEQLQILCERLAVRAERAQLGGGTVTLKLKTARFQPLTRQRPLPQPTARAAVVAQAALPLLRREADGRAFRLLGVGLSQLVPLDQADPPDLFSLPGAGAGG